MPSFFEYDIDFDSYQEATHEVAVFGDGIAEIIEQGNAQEVMELCYLALGLAGEAAEVANKVKKVVRGDYPLESIKVELGGELGDVEWYVSELATLLGISMKQICGDNVTKLRDRKARGVLKGDGDNR